MIRSENEKLTRAQKQTNDFEAVTQQQYRSPRFKFDKNVLCHSK